MHQRLAFAITQTRDVKLMHMAAHELIHDEAHGEAIRAHARRHDALVGLIEFGAALRAVVVMRESFQRVAREVCGARDIDGRGEAQLEAVGLSMHCLDFARHFTVARNLLLR